MEYLKHLEFLAVNSKEIIEKQVDSYRQQHSYGGTIIGATVLFIPFFLSSLDSTNQIIQFILNVPIVCFIWSILLLLSIFSTKPLDQAFYTKVAVDQIALITIKNFTDFENGAASESEVKNKLIKHSYSI